VKVVDHSRFQPFIGTRRTAMAVRVFTDLKIWQRSRAWAKEIFPLTQRGRFLRDRRLVEQVNDSADSLMSNIAEGFGRGTQAELITFLGYAIASLNETQSHLCVAYDRAYLDRETFGKLFAEGTEIRKMTVAFIQSMVLPGSGVKHRRPLVNWTEEVWERYERITGQPRPAMFRTDASIEEEDTARVANGRRRGKNPR
jgi:four helix bundle protein